jgi:pyruvate/2-oxoglutarate dehydrogenase complex dihydrolipoamide acyltransferase (E2) component
MFPTDFIDVEITGHAKNPNSSKQKININKKDEDPTLKEIRMPAISPTMTKGKIVEWLVRTGDTIRKGDPIMVIESEKEVQGARGYRMNQDVNANVDGVLAAIYQQPGQAVDVGAVLGVIVPDFIIDAEIDTGGSNNSSQPVAVDELVSDTKETEIKQDGAEATVAATASEATDSSSTTASTSSSSSSLIDEIMPTYTETQTSDASTASTSSSKADPQYNPDWVHGHHADTDGMVNDHSFYSAHTTQSGSGDMPPPHGSFDSSSHSFYNRYPDSISPPSPPPPPPPHMHPNGADGAGGSFYEAYRDVGDPYAEVGDPYGEQMAQWQQQANSGMGEYYQAERNGQSQFPVEQDAVITPPFGQSAPVNGHAPPFANGQPQDGFANGQVSSWSTADIAPNEEDTEQPQPQRMTQQASASFVNGSPQPVNGMTQPEASVEPKQDAPNIADDTAQDLQQNANTNSQNAFSPTASTSETSENNLVRAAEMESRIANLEQSLHMNGKDSYDFSAKVQDELASLKGGLVDLKKDYDEQVKSLEESYQTSLSQVGRDFTENVEELRDWDSITVTWGIQDFEKTLRKDLTTYTSEEFSVAGYSMTLEMQIFGPNDDGSRDVGFYIMHTGGLNFVPIMIGGSKITILSSSGDNDAVKLFVDDASIEDSHYGWGWKKFFSLQDLKQSYVNSKEEIQVTATVRVKRVRSCCLNTAI